MAFYEFSEEHDTERPPVRVVQGTLSGDPGSYELRLVLEDSKTLFAGPEEVTIPSGGSISIDLPIIECQDNPSSELRSAKALSQYRKDGSSANYVDSSAKFINYRCG
jgi:hypothetical protein